MQSHHRLLSAVALALLSTSAFSTTTIHTSSASFMSSLGAGSYTEAFTGLSNLPAGPFSFNSAGFSYAISAPSSLFAANDFLGTSQIDEALTISFTSGNVTAVGANFFAADLNNAFQATSVTLLLSDGTSTTFTPSSALDSFRGFSSNLTITSLVMSAPGVSLYASIDNLTVGVSAVPEPGSWALMGLGLVGLLAVRRRMA